MVEAHVPTRAAGADQMGPEQVGDSVIPEADVTQRALGAGERGDDHPGWLEMSLASAGLATSQAMTTRTSAWRGWLPRRVQ